MWIFHDSNNGAPLCVQETIGFGFPLTRPSKIAFPPCANLAFLNICSKTGGDGSPGLPVNLCPENEFKFNLIFYELSNLQKTFCINILEILISFDWLIFFFRNLWFDISGTLKFNFSKFIVCFQQDKIRKLNWIKFFETLSIEFFSIR